jgi:hypothetical protein
VLINLTGRAQFPSCRPNPAQAAEFTQSLQYESKGQGR